MRQLLLSVALIVIPIGISGCGAVGAVVTEGGKKLLSSPAVLGGAAVVAAGAEVKAAVEATEQTEIARQQLELDRSREASSSENMQQ